MVESKYSKLCDSIAEEKDRIQNILVQKMADL